MIRLPRLAQLPLCLTLLAASGPSFGGLQDQSYPSYERSLEMVRQEMTRWPEDPGFAQIIARLHLRSAHFVEAAEAFELILKLDPRDGDVWNALGMAYVELGEHPRAIHAFQQVLPLGDASDVRLARLRMADVHYTIGSYAQAIEQLRETQRAGSNQADIHYRLGRALACQAREQEAGAASTQAVERDARASLEQAIMLDPSHSEAHYVLARLLSRLGEKQGARKVMDTFRAISKRGKGTTKELLADSDAVLEAGAAVLLSRLLFENRKVERALNYLDRALAIRPNDDRALALRATIYSKTKRSKKAIAAYEELLRHHPDNPKGLWNLGRLYLKNGRAEDAGGMLLRGAELLNTSESSWVFLYELGIKGELFADRVEEFARHALRVRDSVENYVRLGEALLQAGKLRRAEKAVRGGLLRYPNHTQELQRVLASIMRRRAE